jgi:hypothetical protein
MVAGVRSFCYRFCPNAPCGIKLFYSQKKDNQILVEE